ncbi:MAG: ferritin [bacterium]
MVSKGLTAELNKQINEEVFSAYLYFSMSGYCSFIGLKGTANWFFVQAQEEMTHAWRFYNYINSQGGHVVLTAIAKPDATFKSIQHMFEETLKHEKHITARINLLANLAVKDRDHATQVFLQWFVNEQVEEEQNANDILQKLKLIGKDGAALLMVDNELSARTFVLAPDLAGTGAAGGPAAP